MTSPRVSAAEPRDEALWQRALALHRSAIVVDGHNDITGALTDDGYNLATPSAGKHHTDLPRLREGGVSALFFAIYVDNKFVTNNAATRRPLAVIDATHREIERHPNDLVLCTTAEQTRAARQSGRNTACIMLAPQKGQQRFCRWPPWANQFLGICTKSPGLMMAKALRMSST